MSRGKEVTTIGEIKPVTDEGYVLSTGGFVLDGVEYKFRELTVAENDICRDTATDVDKDTFNGRTMMRMMIVTGALKPEGLDLETVEKWGNRLYSKVIEIVNDLNDPSTLETEPGNA